MIEWMNELQWALNKRNKDNPCSQTAYSLFGDRENTTQMAEEYLEK